MKIGEKKNIQKKKYSKFKVICDKMNVLVFIHSLVDHKNSKIFLKFKK